MIFSAENAPDSQTGFQPGISQNISAVFSRISAILGVGNIHRKIVSDGDTVQVKEQVLYRFCGEFPILENRPFSLISPTPAHAAKAIIKYFKSDIIC